MQNTDILYMFEHKLIPLYCYERKEEFIQSVLEEEQFLFHMLADQFYEYGIEMPYIANQFQVEKKTVSDTISVLKLTFPEPELSPLCYYSYIFFDKDFKTIQYFTIEKMEDEMDQIFSYLGLDDLDTEDVCVCGWTPWDMHMNYGIYEKDEEEGIFEKCLYIYTGMLYSTT